MANIVRKTGWMNPFFEDFFSVPSIFDTDGDTFAPRVDVHETDKQLIMDFELPGMKKNDIKVSVKDNVLTVRGQRETRTEEKNRHYIRREIRTGSFDRRFSLPTGISPDSIKADYKDGILEIRLDKKEEAKPREVEVSVG